MQNLVAHRAHIGVSWRNFGKPLDEREPWRDALEEANASDLEWRVLRRRVDAYRQRVRRIRAKSVPAALEIRHSGPAALIVV